MKVPLTTSPEAEKFPLNISNFTNDDSMDKNNNVKRTDAYMSK